MKKILLLLFCLLFASALVAQNNLEALLTKLKNNKSDDERFDAIQKFYSNTSEANPMLDFKNAQKILLYARKQHDDVAESLAIMQIGYNYRQFGSYAKSLEFSLKAEEIAEANGNKKLIGYTKTCLALVYKALNNYPKAIELLKSGEQLAIEVNSYNLLEGAYQNLSEIYIEQNKIDLALTYAQKDYEISIKNNFREWIGYTLLNLGAIHGKLNNQKLALSYFDMAVRDGIQTKSSKVLTFAYAAKSDYFRETKQLDSSLVYAKKAIVVVQKTPFSNYAIKPAKMLLDIYREQNADSAFKYSEIYRIANDSLFNSKAIQQTEQLTFQSELQQQQIEEERMQNIQYAFIALGIIVFLTVFLLLSRTVIVNEKSISFLSILGLLSVFEFINLLIHPFLEDITHHSPILMLLCLVALASLLIPLHHKLEKWIKEKMTEKNKAIRLASAKKTIEQLEEKS